MSIPPPSGPQQPQDPYQPPQPQGPYAPHPQGPPQGPFQGPPQGPYGGPPYPAWGQGYLPLNRPAPVNGVAIAALVLGVLCFLPAVGLILGIVALVQIRRRGERGMGMAIGGAVLSSLGLALWVVMLATGGASAVWEGFKEGAGAGNTSLSLAKGECFDVPGDTFHEDVYDVDKVPCSGEHDGEVFGTVPLSGSSYPGDDYVTDTAEGKCYTLQDGYAMDPWALTDKVDVYYLTPTRDSWSWGDREITCVFASTDERGTLTGSLRADETTLDADQLAFLKAMAAVDEVLYEEPEEYAEEDLEINQTWAGEAGDVTGEQAEVLRGHTWSADVRKPVADLVKDMEDAGEEWAKAADASDVDTFYEHYDNAYGYVDGDSTVTAREALGLATTPPTYDEDPESGAGSGDEGGLDV
ncbi:DUF4190 domain-containing protein [Streptomyces sp. NPDC014995]|uniref:DUF4190 domain-containing protein n=1 Tax=Streptomyces sp. NPDC014995 TaxID=3364936 RepID=UPI00370330D9